VTHILGADDADQAHLAGGAVDLHLSYRRHTAAGLDERYARGEITREQYFELKADIASA